jgi:hypothetical protein
MAVTFHVVASAVAVAAVSTKAFGGGGGEGGGHLPTRMDLKHYSSYR